MALAHVQKLAESQVKSKSWIYYLSDVWPIAGCPRVAFAVDLVWTPPPLHPDMSSAHPRGFITATPEWGATGTCFRWTTAYKAQRLWDASSCSATAALITAETLMLCCLSMLGPHFGSHYLQYSESQVFFCLCKGWVYIEKDRRDEYIIVHKMGFFFWHTYCRF